MPDPSARASGPSSVLRAWGTAALIVAATTAVAQAQPYRHVDADGRVSYSDIPPAGVAASPRAVPARRLAAASTAPSDRAEASGEAASGDDQGLTALPYAVRAAAGRHPIVLYTSAECAPCADARTYLSRRGVPFTERQVSTGADLAALRQRGFAGDGFPAVSIGAQRLTGFDAGAWGPLLDAAGYPKTSVLPSGWRAPAARPLADGAGGKAAPDRPSGSAAAGRKEAHSLPGVRPAAPEASASASTGVSSREPSGPGATGPAGFRF